MSDLLHRVEKVVAQHKLLADGDAVLVGVSGGVDSMVLLHVLHALARTHHWRLVVAHLHHGLRGRAADLDEQFVARQARKLGLRFESERVEVKKFAQLRKISVEMAARRLRHDFLARTARSLGIGQIALAHHADDQVELFFLRLFRGAGTQGLGGMEWSAPAPANPNLTLLRPMLAETKKTLLEFARARRILHREDATNRSPAIPRNRVRHKLLPLLRRDYQAQVDGLVLRSMELVRTEGDFVTGEAIRWLKSHRRSPSFDALHVALQRRVVQIELLANGIVPQFDHVETLRTRQDKWLCIAPNLLCRRTAQGQIETRLADAGAAVVTEMQFMLGGDGGNLLFGSLDVSWRFLKGAALPPRQAGREFFDADAVGPEIVLRHWRAGDRFQPVGMTHAVKLQDWFVNQKIAKDCRHRLVLATTASGEIFWIEGLRIGEKFKVSGATRRRLEWRWDRK